MKRNIFPASYPIVLPYLVSFYMVSLHQSQKNNTIDIITRTVCKDNILYHITKVSVLLVVLLSLIIIDTPRIV